MSALRERIDALLERLSPRERLLVGAAAAVTALIVVWLVGATLAERRAMLEAQITTSERERHAMVALRDRYVRLRADQEAIRRAVAAGGADFSLFSHLETLTRDSLRADKVAAMNPSSRNVTDTLVADDVEMRLAGVTLRELVDLLYGVEKSDLPLLVSRLQMKKRYDQPYVFDATLVVARLRPASAEPSS